MDIIYDGIVIDIVVNESDCLNGANTMVLACHGDHSDSRGGVVSFAGSNTWFGVDPQTHNCNC